MKKVIMVAVITACLALCAAVWPQPNTREERPNPMPTHTVTDPKAGAMMTAEKEYSEIPQAEPVEESDAASVLLSEEPSPAVGMPQPEPEFPAPQLAIELQLGDEVYIPGFGWVEYEGPNHCEGGTDIYENGNKIGIMG